MYLNYIVLTLAPALSKNTSENRKSSEYSAFSIGRLTLYEKDSFDHLSVYKLLCWLMEMAWIERKEEESLALGTHNKPDIVDDPQRTPFGRHSEFPMQMLLPPYSYPSRI